MWRAWWLCLLAGACSQFHLIAPDGGVVGDDLRILMPESPDGGVLRAVWGSGQGDVHAVGDDGLVYDWIGGQQYQPVLGSGKDLTGVWGSGPNDVWAVGTERVARDGVIFHKTGDTWVQFGKSKYGLKSVWGVDDVRFAVGLSGAVYQGPTATPFSGGMQIEPDPVVPPGPDAPVLWSISGNSGSAIMVAGDVDATYFFDGTMWHAYLDPVDRTRTFRAMFGAPGDMPSIYQGANYFGLWWFTGKDNPVLQLNEEKDDAAKTNQFVWAIWGPSDQQVVAVGDAGRIMTYDATTQKVLMHPSPTTRSLYGVWGASLDDVWIVGDGGVVLRGKLSTR